MELLTKLLNDFKSSAKRIETLPIYRVDDELEEYERYINGVLEFEFEKNNWIKTIERVNKSGGNMGRVRVIPKQINSYIRFETETGYVPNSVAGEKISVLSQTEYENITPLELRGDFWIFDNTIVLKLNYSKEGEFLYSEIVKDDELSKKIMDLYQELEKHSKPLNHSVKIIRNIDEINYY